MHTALWSLHTYFWSAPNFSGSAHNFMFWAEWAFRAIVAMDRGKDFTYFISYKIWNTIDVMVRDNSTIWIFTLMEEHSTLKMSGQKEEKNINIGIICDDTNRFFVYPTCIHGMHR